MLLVDKNIGAVLDINNRIIIQYGGITKQNGSNNYNLTFPISFSTTNYSCMVADVAYPQGNPVALAMGIYSYKNNGLLIYFTTNQLRAFKWLVMGY